MRNILLIWDIDGTLIDSKGCGRRAMDRAFHLLFGLENGFKNVTMAGRLDAHIVKEAMENNGIENRNMGLFFDTYCKILEEEVISEQRPEILAGVKEILKKNLNSFRIVHVLGTGNMEKGARIKLSVHDINHHFPLGGFGDEEKERWEIIQNAIERAENYFQIKFPKDQVYVIGDTPLDIECGKILGIKSVAVATGIHNMEELIKYQPDHIFSSLLDTESFFQMFL